MPAYPYRLPTFFLIGIPLIGIPTLGLLALACLPSAAQTPERLAPEHPMLEHPTLEHPTLEHPGKPASAKPGRAARPASETPAAKEKAARTGEATAPSKETARAKNNASLVTVTARANAEVGGATFTLGEIADIAGDDRELKQQLSAVPIGTSPLPGLSRSLFPGDIIVHLRASHLESKRVQVLAPPAMRITRLGHSVASEEILRVALAAAQPAIKDIPNATLEPEPNGRSFTVPVGKVQIVAGAWRGQAPGGLISVPVSILVDGQPAQTGEVLLRMHRKQTVVVAKRTIEAHEILSAEDVALALTDLPPGVTQPLLDIQEALGKRATRRLAAGMPLAATALETPPAIATNDKVTIEFVIGPIHITAPGQARQAGAVGDTIHVVATDTHKELDAMIVDSHTVRVANSDNP